MQRSHWQKIEKILDRALAFDSLNEQEKYLEEACGDDPVLFFEIRLLVRSIHDAQRTGYLEEE
ncbi:hypothetical protein [Fodinibius sediminis]|uniref:Uncharacterized protein n=1 Tax=Fodinibius sediminis TaxID=1214077 RepID=A0A521CBI8_9BACT|nr:hypothetical protein [Fodinibius sediminis]SMO56171.1 hypothetical protein SAMN06265218_105176 [Fodinibius sediminis]